MIDFFQNDIRDTDSQDLIISYINNIINSMPCLQTGSFVRNGGVLFRGFNIDSAAKFDKVIRSLSKNTINYKDGNSPRDKISDRVYTSTEYPHALTITQHNELSYSKKWPRYLIFCCVIQPEAGGQTPLTDGRKVFLEVSNDIKYAFEEKKIKYIRNLPNGYGIGKSWQDTFETNCKYEVEAFCAEMDICYGWGENDSLHLEQIGPTYIRHPNKQHYVWFNQVNQFHTSTLPKSIFTSLQEVCGNDKLSYPHYVVYADSTEIPPKYIQEIESVIADNTSSFDWERGDVLLIDNVGLMHGRRPFEGNRKILVSCLDN